MNTYQQTKTPFFHLSLSLKLRLSLGVISSFSLFLLTSCQQKIIQLPQPRTNNSPTANQRGTTLNQANSRLSLKDREWLANKIWQNESSRSYAGLTSWNNGEQFASLGIGHMIWYPANYNGAFDESFPQWISWMQRHHLELLPSWLNSQPIPTCPWTSQKHFIDQQNSLKMKELRTFLSISKIEQVDYIILRSQQSRAKLANYVASQHRKHVLSNYDKLSQTPQGQYALIDYVNFKGEGLKSSERYQGIGWGLYQVLLEMPANTPSSKASSAFAQAAQKVLTRRVKNSPKSRNENRWLEGWINRCHTYR